MRCCRRALLRRAFSDNAPRRSSVASSQQAKIVAFCAMAEPSSDRPAKRPCPRATRGRCCGISARTGSERDELLKGTGIRKQILSEPGADMPVSSLVVLAANITRRHGRCGRYPRATVWSDLACRARSMSRCEPRRPSRTPLNTGARFGSIRAPFIRSRLRLETARLRPDRDLPGLRPRRHPVARGGAGGRAST